MLIGVIAEELLLPFGPAFGTLIDPDIFPSANIRVAGYLLFEGQFDEGDTIYNAFVTEDSPSIFPPLLVDPDVFYAFSAAKIVTIAPSLVQDIDAFYAPTVLSKVLGPSLLIDDDLFGGTRKITQGKASINQTFPIDNVLDFDVIYSPLVQRSGVTLITQQAALATDFDVLLVSETTSSTIPLLGSFVEETASFTAPPLGNLSPHLAADSDSFFTPDARGSLNAGLFTDVDVFYVPARSDYLLPGAMLASDVFFAAFTANQLRPGIVVDVDNVFGPAFTQPGAFALYVDAAEFVPAAGVVLQPYLLTPAAFNPADVFYVPSINPAILPAIYLAGDIFFVPSMGLGPLVPVVSFIETDVFFPPGVIAGRLNAGFVIDGDTIFAPNIPATLAPSIVSDSGTIYAPAAAQGLAPSGVADSGTFFAPLVSLNSVMDVVTDADVVLAPTVIPGAVTAAPTFVGSDDVIFSAICVSTDSLVASLVADSDTIFVPTESSVGQPAVVTDTDTFFAPRVTQAGFDGAVSIDGPIMPRTPPITVILVEDS